jgi:hypothetical protein
MRNRITFTSRRASLRSLGLLAAILTACASPQATQPQIPSAEPLLPTPTVIQPLVSTDTSAAPTTVLEAPTLTPIPVATSRGPDLHATDPTTVNLASGQYQFVEFFRFT